MNKRFDSAPPSQHNNRELKARRLPTLIPNRLHPSSTRRTGADPLECPPGSARSLGLGAFLRLRGNHPGLLLWDEHTDGEVACLRAILVLHNQPVFARVRGGHPVDSEEGGLACFKPEAAVIVRGQGLLILQPGDLWSRVTPHGASEIKCLQNRFDERRGEIADIMINFKNPLMVWHNSVEDKYKPPRGGFELAMYMHLCELQFEIKPEVSLGCWLSAFGNTDHQNHTVCFQFPSPFSLS